MRLLVHDIHSLQRHKMHSNLVYVKVNELDTLANVIYNELLIKLRMDIKDIYQ